MEFFFCSIHTVTTNQLNRNSKSIERCMSLIFLTAVVTFNRRYSVLFEWLEAQKTLCQQNGFIFDTQPFVFHLLWYVVVEHLKKKE